MKTAIKTAAIAAITILSVLACSDDAGLTVRDYGARNESLNAEYTNVTSYAPVIRTTVLYYGSTEGESAKEITITFPANADILKAANADMTAGLTEFFNIYQYSNPAIRPEPLVYTPSIMGDIVPYSFVRRNNNVIIIKLDSIPNISQIEAKIDASKYRCSGQVLDFNGDGKGGESYDDQYTGIRISGGESLDGYTNTFYRPEFITPINLNISGPSGGTFTAVNASRFVTVIDSGSSGDNNAYMRKILSDLIPNIELQIYDQTAKTWVKEGAVTLYEYTGTVPENFPTGFTSDRLYVKIDALEDLGIYRVKATGLSDLTTRDNYGATSKPAKITINGAFRFNDFYSNPVSYYNNEIRNWETANPINNVIVKSDANKKNVVLELYFREIDGKYPQQLTTEQFNESVKLVYLNEYPYIIPADGNFAGRSDLVELKITDITYSASRQFSATNTNINCVTVTLDPAYRIDGGRAISLLLSPGFKYAGGYVTFGGTNNIVTTYYNGTFFWRSYGRLGTINL